MSRTPRVIDNPLLTRRLVSVGSFKTDPVFIIDIGASGGIDSYWNEFDGQLKAVGFDPLVAEVERLNADAPSGVEYVAAWVTSSASVPDGDVPTTEFWTRTSALRAADVASLDYAREYYNANAEVELATARIELDGYFSTDEGGRIDFIKVDTDGHDYAALRGSEGILSSGRVVGMAVEAPFQGPVSRDANLFSNIDAYLRSKGFALFDLEVYRYSRAALPAKFAMDLPANTTTGQVLWGEAVYFRDLGDPRYEEMWSFEPTLETVLKLASFFEIFGLLDCAAELILKYADLIGESASTEMLDTLAKEQSEDHATYASLLEEFGASARSRSWLPRPPLEANVPAPTKRWQLRRLRTPR